VNVWKRRNVRSWIMAPRLCVLAPPCTLELARALELAPEECIRLVLDLKP
jgi:hypothetical protein